MVATTALVIMSGALGEEGEAGERRAQAEQPPLRPAGAALRLFLEELTGACDSFISGEDGGRHADDPFWSDETVKLA